MKSTELITFENDVLGTIRGFIDKDGEPWFLAAQVCRCLGIKESDKAVKQTEERMKIAEDYYKSVGRVSNTVFHAKKISLDNGNFGKTLVYVIPEQFLYELIFASRKQTAIVFRAWVTGEVLPSLRKHGEYRMEGKLIRRELTDAIQDSGENERMHGYGYPTYTKMIYKSLGLANKVDRDKLSLDMKERLAHRENLVQSLIAEGKQYSEIKNFIENNFKSVSGLRSDLEIIAKEKDSKKLA
ncbi:MAG: hypothetical protein J6S85_19495 [Methanobrevibacter sp.]|nr:hypothetical protein [Methanobrevibacter sp.]